MGLVVYGLICILLVTPSVFTAIDASKYPYEAFDAVKASKTGLVLSPIPALFCCWLIGPGIAITWYVSLKPKVQAAIASGTALQVAEDYASMGPGLTHNQRRITARFLGELQDHAANGLTTCTLTFKESEVGTVLADKRHTATTIADELQRQGYSVAHIEVPDAGWQVWITVALNPSAQPPPPSGAQTTSQDSIIHFDPEGPEMAGQQGQAAYRETRFADAFGCYVKAIDRLHDFYAYENFKNRQPSPADAWLVDGLTASLGAARSIDPSLDVSEQVREATHRLRAITTASEHAGANATLYRQGLDKLAEYAPEVDVSDIYWD